MIYGYARVSTINQAKDGNSLKCQHEQLTERGAVVVYSDSYTGIKKSRPELDKLMSILQDGDILMITKLDRMARSVKDGIDIIDGLVERGVIIDILNMGRFDNTAMGRLMRNIMLSFAEYEHAMILERTSEGRERKRQTDVTYKEGRPKMNISREVVVKHFEDVSNGVITVNEAVHSLNISRSKWYLLAKEYGYRRSA